MSAETAGWLLVASPILAILVFGFVVDPDATLYVLGVVAVALIVAFPITLGLVLLGAR